MSTQAGEWVGASPPDDERWVEAAPGGALSNEGRQAAVSAALSLLALYFAGGNQGLAAQNAGSRTLEPVLTDETTAGLRFRVALAASSKLTELLAKISQRPTFRYAFRRTEHEGGLGGTLDVERWATRPRTTSSEVRFPVAEVVRGSRTPENVLAVYAALWIRRELRTSFALSSATSSSADYRVMQKSLRTIDRTLAIPALMECRAEASALRTSGAVARLLSQVQRRLNRREITNISPYRELHEWVTASVNGLPVVTPGDLELAVYGEKFDQKLFELWCIELLSVTLAARLNLPKPTPNPEWRRGAPTYAFESFFGRIELHFQKSVKTVDPSYQSRWVREDGRTLGGIPDIILRAQPSGSSDFLAIIDPKLRQRNRLPAEEIYKILGYIQNFAVSPAFGVVLTYTTQDTLEAPVIFRDESGGVLLSVQVNPSASASMNESAAASIVDEVLRKFGYEPSKDDVGVEGLDPGEAIIAGIEKSLYQWGQLNLEQIAPSRERIESLVGTNRWSGLSEDIQVMMATADLVGHQLSPEADFSGPVIGMCAAVESLLHQTIQPIIDLDPTRQRQFRTLGAVIDALDHALIGKGGEVVQDLRAHLSRSGVDSVAATALLGEWREMNTNYRIPAAHRVVVRHGDWQHLYRLVVGQSNLFNRTFDTLRPQV